MNKSIQHFINKHESTVAEIDTVVNGPTWALADGAGILVGENLLNAHLLN